MIIKIPVEIDCQPCLFCGSDSLTMKEGVDLGLYYTVECLGCTACGPKVDIHDYSNSAEAELKATQMWNNR